jgi:7,8-dihydropterin-6-yl-methyl-4-(beta-D-ribofuranosyl)aminobenzene 5'-phosphate synthase
VKAAGGKLLQVTGSIPITKGILTSGEIERKEDLEEVTDFWTVSHNKLVKDRIMDDQALVIEIADKGLFIITGCAHSGIINTLKHAQQMMGNNRIHAILGGFHLATENNNRIKATINELSKFDPAFIWPGHCTGSKSIRLLKTAFGKRCQRLHTGKIIEV